MSKQVGKKEVVGIKIPQTDKFTKLFWPIYDILAHLPQNL